MRTNRRWLAGVTGVLGLALVGTTGCQTQMGGMTLPSGRYLEHYPQYFAPDPAHPLPRELASQEDPAGEARRGAGIGGGVPGAGGAAGVPGQPGGLPLSGGPR